jgi:proteasome assembly chaperone (PAC2) family protein
MTRADLREPWLVAVWPGMGAVALVAGHYLHQTLGAEPEAEVPLDAFFDVQRVQVKNGVVEETKRPGSALYVWRNPAPDGKDLLIFVGEAQPESRGWDYAAALLDHMAAYGVRRVVTFAAMATPSDPRATPRVFAAATSERVLADIHPGEVERLGEGEIAGLNGVLLGAAAKRGLDGLCLLGEFPFFAPGIPNPKASAAVLRTFQRLFGLDLDLERLDAEGRRVEAQLTALLERLRKEAMPGQEEGAEEAGRAPWEATTEPEEAESEGPSEEDRRRIESLFAKAKENRKYALELKSELDRLGLFKAYEDRFLDLFKRGE